MMRRSAAALLSAFIVVFGSSGGARAQERSAAADRDWYVALKRVAKYGRIAIETRNHGRADAEKTNAYRSVVAADQLAEPYRITCKDAAWALVEAIESDRVYAWPEGTEPPFRKVERLSDVCLAAINGR